MKMNQIVTALSPEITSDHLNNPVVQGISLSALGATFLHVLPELALIPPAIYYCLLIWLTLRDKNKGKK